MGKRYSCVPQIGNYNSYNLWTYNFQRFYSLQTTDYNDVQVLMRIMFPFYLYCSLRLDDQFTVVSSFSVIIFFIFVAGITVQDSLQVKGVEY